MKIHYASDHSASPPRLIIYGNVWGLSELPRRPADVTWTLEEVLDKIAAAGFEGMQGEFKDARTIHRKGLRYAAHARANSPHEVEDLVHEASDCGADCLVLHAGWGMESDEEMAEYAIATLEAAAMQRLPIFLETHRATILQDIYRTCRLVEKYPELRFNGDFSHYYCGHEMIGRGIAKSREYLHPILQRVGFIHGRVSNGESIQIDVGDGKSNWHARNFVWFWQTAMTYWLQQARPGDLLPFVPELGPPSSGYSITYTDERGATIEPSDRWAQTLVMAELGREAFEMAKSQVAAGNGA